MPQEQSEEMMQTLIAKLYATITGNDDAIKLPRSKFVTWMLPGLPFEEADFLYCSKGLIADTAEETLTRYHNAFVLSKLFDLIPEVGADKGFMDSAMQQTVFTSTQDGISAVYRDVLKHSRVVDRPLKPEQVEKLTKFRNLLSVTKEVVNIVTDEKSEVTEPGPVTVAYNTYLNNYLEAADGYMNLLINAQSAKGNDPEAIRRVAEFSAKGSLMRKKVDAAWDAWVAQGYKNEYEQMTAYIDQVTQASMVLYKRDLLNKFRASVVSSASDGGAEFHYTTLIPGSFAGSKGWSQFRYYVGDQETHANKKTSQWGAGGSGRFGLFKVGAKASGSKMSATSSQKASNFRAEFEFVQVPICRPWYEPGFFAMRGWTLDDLWNLNYGQPVSNGAAEPVGRLVAYPTSALFVRNVKLTFDEAESTMQEARSAFQAGGKVGWGPFSLGGSHARGSESRDTTAHVEGKSLIIEGIQLIGMINNIIPKSPDPHPDLKPEDFVGG